MSKFIVYALNLIAKILYEQKFKMQLICQQNNTFKFRFYQDNKDISQKNAE